MRHSPILPAVATRPFHCSTVIGTGSNPIQEWLDEQHVHPLIKFGAVSVIGLISGFLAHHRHHLVGSIREALANKGHIVGCVLEHKEYEQEAELIEIKKKFKRLRKRNKGDKSVAVYLTGPPACGKTQTARQFAERFYEENRRRFVGNKLVVAFLNATDQKTLLRSLEVLAEELGCPVPASYKDPISEEQQLKYYSDAVKKVLRRRPGWLLVIDNPGTPRTTRTASDTNRYNISPHHEWRHLLPQPGDKSWGKGHVLITTYDRQLVEIYSNFVEEHAMKLDGIPVNDAVKLLKDICGYDLPGDAEDVVNSPHIDRRLLLIMSAAIYIKDRRDQDNTYSCEKYMDELQAASEELNFPLYTRPAINMAVKQLASGYQELHKVFILLASCGESPVPMSIVKRLPGVYDKQGMSPKVERCTLLNLHCGEEKGLQCISHYRGYRDSFHKLLSDPIDVKDRDGILNAVVDSVVAEYKEAEKLSTVKSYQMRRLLVSHMGNLFHLLEIPKLEFSLDATRDIQLCTALADACRLDGKAIESEQMLLRVLDTCGKGPGKDSIEAARAYEELGKTYRQMSKFQDSEEKFTEALAIFEDRCGKDSVEVARVLVSCGSTLQEMGKYSESKNDLERARAILERNPKSESLAVAYTILSTTLQSLGDVEGSKKLLEEAYKLQKDFDSPSVAVTLNHLGIAYLDVGDPAKSVEMLEEALEINKRFHGEDHSSVAITLSNLCRAHTRLGNIEESNAYGREAWRKAEAIHGQKHPEVARALMILGDSYRITGEFHPAVLKLQQSVDIYKAVRGVQHADTANAQTALGKAQRLAGQLGRSEQTLNEALKTQEELFGKNSNHHDTRATQDALGRLYRDMGYLTRSLQAFHTAHDIGVKSFSSNPDHPKLASTMCEHSRTLRKAGRIQEAIKMMETALGIFERSGYSKFHPKYLDMLAIMGVILRDQDNSKSKEYLEKALDIQEKIFPTANMMKAQTFHNLGIAYHILGDEVKALEKVQESLDMMSTIQWDHYKVASILTARAILRDSKGDYVGAREDFREALQICWKWYEDMTHPDIALNYKYLAENAKKCGLKLLAEEYWDQARNIYEILYKREETASIESGIEIPIITKWKDVMDERF